MQSVVDAAKSAATTATNLATSAATTAASYTGLAGGHSHAEEHTAGAGASGSTGGAAALPEDAEPSEVRKMDSEGLAVFEEEGVRHEVLVKINKLAIEDARHGLKEVAALDLVGPDGVKKGIQYYHPQRYFTVTRPSGIAYIGEIEIEDGKSIHVRCNKAGTGNKATFHSIDTRPSEEGGAVFKTGEPLSWFDY
ncbi:hypothetical protein I317_00460 [Kwoniella heveanensis CBS 569]|uniref:Uncharacterized protein n=1 Tax=Kwoniella heveanensis BCC8398 TaxID=1296120 RepID=A0A1B9GY45_9TREE|nr:hypothetical protein I316_02434 [Kwoniella heveanensis BCC8398]OCF45558.1 hypothetical protein I317_00460 [Kwoniella heveanensis CBS 569]